MVWRLWRQLSTTPVTFVNMIVDSGRHYRHPPFKFYGKQTEKHYEFELESRQSPIKNRVAQQNWDQIWTQHA